MTAAARRTSSFENAVNSRAPGAPSRSHSLPCRCSTSGGRPRRTLITSGRSRNKAVRLWAVAT